MVFCCCACEWAVGEGGCVHPTLNSPSIACSHLSCVGTDVSHTSGQIRGSIYIQRNASHTLEYVGVLAFREVIDDVIKAHLEKVQPRPQRHHKGVREGLAVSHLTIARPHGLLHQKRRDESGRHRESKLSGNGLGEVSGGAVEEDGEQVLYLGESLLDLLCGLSQGHTAHVRGGDDGRDVVRIGLDC